MPCTVGASLLAKNVNDNACILDERGVYEFFASKLAPTGENRRQKKPGFWGGESGLRPLGVKQGYAVRRYPGRRFTWGRCRVDT
ncbi:hypothetical protein CIB54_24180 [Pseudomonas fluorescens]|uniref:Uncharacterized protein n=1 Tax=Pseudomonas fluorescens TaxID=294 RepID=A0A2N1DWR3_PSEFL|nr:hypothetical protein CIB54_24180 [Pseudomonas fluorescens]